MFWNRELPPELRDKKPEEIVAALEKLKELESKSAEFESAKSDWETQLNAQKGEYDTVRQKLQELEAGVANYQQQQQAAAQMQQQPSEPTSIWNNPDQYIAEKTGSTQFVALAAAKMGARLTFLQSLSPREQKIFEKYAKEVDRTMNGYDPASQGMPQNWHTAFTYVKGLHEQDIGKMEADGTPFFSEPASRGAEPPPPPEDKLTAEEEEICRRFHWDTKGYLQRKKEMSVHQSEKGSFAHFPVPMRSRP